MKQGAMNKTVCILKFYNILDFHQARRKVQTPLLHAFRFAYQEHVNHHSES